MRNGLSCLALAAVLATTATATAATGTPPPIAEAEAARLADATVAAWKSTDAARIKALYAPGIVGFDMGAAPLATDRATWDRYQDGFAAAKFDRQIEKSRRIQILGGDIFVVSGTWDISSSTIPANKTTARCTDVYQRTAGRWLIVNEHCSEAPTG